MKFFIATFILALLLSGCTEKTAVHPQHPQVSSISLTSLSPTATAPVYDSNVKPVDTTNHSLSFSDEGFYQRIYLGQYVYLTYTDLANMRTVFLCSAPNCTHSDDSCTALYGGNTTRRIEQLFTSYDNSALIRVEAIGATDSSYNQSITTSALSGAQPSLIFSSSTQEITPIAVGQNNIYIENYTSLDGTGLHAIEIATGNTKLIYRIDTEKTYMVDYFPYGSDIYVINDIIIEDKRDPDNFDDHFKLPDSREFRVEKINLITGEVTRLYSEILSAENLMYGTMHKGIFYQGVFLDINADEGNKTIRRLDYSTGEFIDIGNFGDIPHLAHPSMSYIEDYLSIVVYDEQLGSSYYRHMNLNTGKLTDTHFHYTSNEMGGSYDITMDILYDLGDSLLLETGETLIAFEVYDDMLQQYVYPQNAIKSLAIICKDDYFAGNLNLQPINNSTIINAVS